MSNVKIRPLSFRYNCRRQIQYFTQLNRDFEWKVYSHDEPPDSLSHLRSRAFRIGEEESLMFSDSRELPPTLREPPPEGVTVIPVKKEQAIADFLLNSSP